MYYIVSLSRRHKTQRDKLAERASNTTIGRFMYGHAYSQTDRQTDRRPTVGVARTLMHSGLRKRSAREPAVD